MQAEEIQNTNTNLEYAQDTKEAKGEQYNQQEWNRQQSSDIDTTNTSLKTNNEQNGQNSPGGANFEMSSSSGSVNAQNIPNQQARSSLSGPSDQKEINLEEKDSKNESYSPTRSIMLFNKSTVLGQSQQVTFGKSSSGMGGDSSESSSPARSVRSSKSNRSSILTIRQTNSNRSSIEQEMKSGNGLHEKKRARYRYVKNWEDKRIQITSIFNNIFCNLSENLVKIASQSNEFIDNLLNFLKETQIQLAQYAKAPLSQVGEAYGYTPQINNVHYPTINKIFKQVSSIDSSSGNNYQDLSMFIDQSIVRPYLLADKKNFSQKFEAFSTTVKEKKSKIQKLSKVAVTAYDEYTNLFKEMVQLQNKGKDLKKDFYYQELVFMHHANDHFENLRDFGILVYRFLEELEQLQINRIKSINQALTLYLKKRQDLVDGLENTDHIMTMLQQMQSEMDKHVVNIETLLQPEQSNYIKKCYSQEEINKEIIKQFAHDFQLKAPGEKTLIVKEFTAQQIEKENNPNKEWKDCSIILTVDNYLIVSPGLLDSFSKPSTIIYLPFSKATFQKESMIVTIVETTKKLFWNSKKSFHFKLQHEYDANEITSFLQENSHVFSQKNALPDSVVINIQPSQISKRSDRK